MIPDDIGERARLTRARYLVPRIRAAAAHDEAGRQAARLVEWDDYLKSKDAAEQMKREAGEAERLRFAHTELQERHTALEREHEALQRQYDALFRRMHSTDGRERGKGKGPS